MGSILCKLEAKISSLDACQAVRKRRAMEAKFLPFNSFTRDAARSLCIIWNLCLLFAQKDGKKHPDFAAALEVRLTEERSEDIHISCHVGHSEPCLQN